jgi:hypothetical protein
MMRWAVLLTVLATASQAFAQQAPGGIEEHAEAVGTRGEENDVRLALSAGTSLTYGNARNLAINLGADFQLRWDEHALAANVSWIYGMASLRGADPMMPTEFGDWAESANNATWKLRYDYFITPEDAVFIVVKGRYDPFAQLTPRIGLQAGYMRNIVREENHRFWVEAGYDFTYDFFPQPLQIGTDDMGNPLLATERQLHSLRLFIGYDNRINEVLTYTTGFEALMRLDRPEHWRFEWVNQFRSKLMEWLQISLDVTGRLDSLPPGQAEAWNEQGMQPAQMFDLIVTLNVVGTFDLFTAPAEPEPEEECECPEPECPEPAIQEPVEPVEEPVEEPSEEPAVEEGAEPAIDAVEPEPAL